MATQDTLFTRRTKRLDAGWRVLILLPGTETAEGRISDISAGGLQFTSPLEYKAGNIVALDIITSPKKFFRTRISIVRRVSRGVATWTYGARFVDMSSLDRILLDSGISSLTPETEEEAD